MTNAEKLQTTAYLAGQGGNDALCVDKVGLAQVIKAVRGEDLGSSLPPDGLSKLQRMHRALEC